MVVYLVSILSILSWDASIDTPRIPSRSKRQLPMYQKDAIYSMNVSRQIALYQCLYTETHYCRKDPRTIADWNAYMLHCHLQARSVPCCNFTDNALCCRTTPKQASLVGVSTTSRRRLPSRRPGGDSSAGGNNCSGWSPSPCGETLAG